MHGRIDHRVLWSFGLTSAAGGLAGSLLYGIASSGSLTVVFAALLLFAAAGEITGFARRMRFRGWIAWVAGALSGFLGGFVGTATAIALFVDGARVPIYLYMQHEQMRVLLLWIVLATGGVIVGTLVGSHTLGRIPEVWFRRVLALTLAVLGVVMLIRAA